MTSFYSCSKLYRQCVEVLANITPSSSKHPGGEEECFLLKECLQELILWGEGFEGEELGTALNRSPFLRDTTIQFLCGVGKELVQVAIPLLVEDRDTAKNAHIWTLAANLKREIREAKFLIQTLQGEQLHDDAADELRLESLDPSQRSLKYASHRIRFFVTRLINLQPCMEDLLNFRPPNAADCERLNSGIVTVEDYYARAASMPNKVEPINSRPNLQRLCGDWSSFGKIEESRAQKPLNSPTIPFARESFHRSFSEPSLPEHSVGIECTTPTYVLVHSD